MIDSVVHPFQTAGLGQAPFRLRGVFEKVYVACPGAPARPAGTCDYCGTGVKYCCDIESADGNRFIVGCDCVRKLDRADNRLIGEVERKMRTIEQAKRDAKRKATIEREEARIAKALDRLPYARGRLAAQPHPCIPDNSLLDYVQWMIQHAGRSGRLRVARLIEFFDA